MCNRRITGERGRTNDGGLIKITTPARCAAATSPETYALFVVRATVAVKIILISDRDENGETARVPSRNLSETVPSPVSGPSERVGPSGRFSHFYARTKSVSGNRACFVTSPPPSVRFSRLSRRAGGRSCPKSDRPSTVGAFTEPSFHIRIRVAGPARPVHP